MVPTKTEMATLEDFFDLHFKPALEKYGIKTYEQAFGKIGKRNADMGHSIQIGINATRREFIRLESIAATHPSYAKECEERMLKFLAAQLMNFEAWLSDINKFPNDSSSNTFPPVRRK